MTVYRGKTNTRRGQRVAVESVKRLPRYYINIVLGIFLFIAFLGNILVSNDFVAKGHVIKSMKSTYNSKTAVQNTPTPDNEYITIEELIEYADKNGMVESKEVIGLINNGGVALSK